MISSSSPADPTAATGPLGIAAEKNKQWQRELLMEKIRSHSSQHKTFQELSKSMRLSMLEKRYALDAVEKSNLQKCLDSMQHCIKVTSRQGLVERLESLSRQLGLKFMEDKSGLFISTDMFYLEIILDSNGSLTDVKVHHECKIEQQSCSELVNCLNRGDFADFTVQLDGLTSIYQLNAEPKVKTKAFVALQAMETDLYSLYQAQNFANDAKAILTESSVGIALRRRGGHPMRLTYFVSPYDLINLEMKSMIPLTVDLVTSKNLGMSVTVNLEASSANKLQILPTVSFTKEGMTDVPVYSPLTPQNSTLLPATFVLRLNTPLPVCQNLLRTIMPVQTTTEPGGAGATAVVQGESSTMTSSIMKLVIQTASENQLQNSSKGLFVCLPDQTHCYFFTENKQMKASIVSSVPFTEPSQVPKILAVLKKHALFYTLLSSCVRPQTKMGDLESTTILEVNAISFSQISVALEHPYEESMATVEFNLNELGLVTCEIYSLSNNYESLAANLTLIVQTSMSIPITIRSLLKYWHQERMKCFQRGNGNEYGNFNLGQGPIDPGGRGGDFRDIKGPKPGGTDRGGSNFGAGNNRPFFHATGITGTGAEGFPELSSSVGPVAGTNSLIKTQFKSEVKQEDFCKSPKSNHTLQSDISSNDSSSLGTLSAAQQQTCSNTQELSTYSAGVAANVATAVASGVAVPTTPSTTATSTNLLKSDQDRSADIAGKYQKIWKDKTNTVKNTVSITPITTTTPAMDSAVNPSQGNLEKRPGIEIIPLTTPPSQNSVSSTITITPINPTSTAPPSIPTVSITGVKSSEKKSSSSSKRSADDKDSKSEKKRKKKREDSPMGPPEKMFSRQNSPASDPISRKYSPQTTPCMGLPGTKPSPKHSPVYTSPKHASSSPKSPFGTLSPKHGSSGKPSMSTLKNATSPKSEKSTLALPTRPLSSPGLSSSKNRDKDGKERLLSVPNPNSKTPTSPKVKSATIKLKPLDVGNHLGFSGLSDESDKARKSSLNAVIDKLKSSQNSSDGTDKLTNSGNASDSTPTTPGTPGSEYMVKPGQDGIKITINKTKTKDGGGGSSNFNRTKTINNKPVDMGNSSPKKHTGLKPGVNSGPASKKSSATLPFPAAPPMPTNKSSSSSSGSSSSSSSQGTKYNFQKSNSSGSLSTKLSANSTGGGGSSLTKSHSTNSFHSDSFRKSASSSSSSSSSNNKSRSSSGFIEKITPRPDPTDMMKILQFASPNMAAMEGFMKTFNTKFQIPKLSARNSNSQPPHDGDKPRPISAPTTPAPSFTPSPTPSSSESSGNSNDSNKNPPKISGPAAQPNKANTVGVVGEKFPKRLTQQQNDLELFLVGR
ncbi:mediator of RNA polymerase II transcription subunit 1 isoform X2 [Episyrphus balteatus]|uniref:mediator of RNA polymerase II transcription subunit 1 isoform X2 n=1 Tax=Episyrphus balteatus TaxID=286459 RepID=UPI002485249E|nr:mediator of RNA polymerase II transcription subunit 1 isoform X2 [Episyrphus balteatus]